MRVAAFFNLCSPSPFHDYSGTILLQSSIQVDHLKYFGDYEIDMKPTLFLIIILLLQFCQIKNKIHIEI